MEEEDIKVSLNENHLTIVGEINKPEESFEEKGKPLLVERFSGGFQRTFTLPSNRLDSIGSKAKFKNGILRITVTKAEEIRPREIRFES